MSVQRRRPAAKSEVRRQFALFVLVGGFAALVNVLSRIALNPVMSYEFAIVVAYGCGMTMAYVLNRLYVFVPSGRAIHDEYLRFVLVNLVAVAQVWVVSIGLVWVIFPWAGFIWHPETVAHVIGVIVPVFTSYLGHRYFSFSSARL